MIYILNDICEIMTDPLIIKILYGLIATSLIGIVISIALQVLKTKADKITGNQALGYLVFITLTMAWYVGLIWYWFSLLAQIE